jgi:integrase
MLFMQPTGRDIVAARISARTRKSYQSYISVFTKLSSIPLPLVTDEQVMSAFIPFKGRSQRYIYSLRAAIAAFQLDNGMPPTPWAKVKGNAPASGSTPIMIANTEAFFKGLKKLAPKPALPGQSGCLPLPIHTANAIIDHLLSQPRLDHFRNAIGVLLQFYAMRRYDEIRTIQQGDLFDRSVGKGVTFSIRNMKGDISHAITLSETVCTGRAFAPLVRLFITATESLKGYLFRATTSDGLRWADVNSPLTIGTYQSALNAAIDAVAPDTDPRRRTTHALRKGGFTCARESGMPIEIANAIIGHVSNAMWQYYYIPSTERVHFYFEGMGPPLETRQGRYAA